MYVCVRQTHKSNAHMLANVHTKLTTVGMASDQGESFWQWKGLNATKTGAWDSPPFTCSWHKSIGKQS